MDLKEFAGKHPKAVVAFSGGVDSSYLLYAGLQAGADWQPVFIRSVFQPDFELEDAQRMCKELHVELNILDMDVLSLQEVRDNPADRCYYCKRALFGKLRGWAASQGIDVILDGNNASDSVSDRPGMRAVKELGVLSPLREAGLTKADIRRLSKAAGLFTWNKLSYACLATRIPAGTSLDAETLKKVDAGEAALRDLGFTDLRIRVFHGAGRIQLPADEMLLAIRMREKILQALKPLFPAVMLDMESRPGNTDMIPTSEGNN